jgi:hypothetical protein
VCRTEVGNGARKIWQNCLDSSTKWQAFDHAAGNLNRSTDAPIGSRKGAVRRLDSATGEAPAQIEKAKDPSAVARGRKGGKARAAEFAERQLSDGAKKAVKARWTRNR